MFVIWNAMGIKRKRKLNDVIITGLPEAVHIFPSRVVVFLISLFIF